MSARTSQVLCQRSAGKGGGARHYVTSHRGLAVREPVTEARWMHVAHYQSRPYRYTEIASTRSHAFYRCVGTVRLVGAREIGTSHYMEWAFCVYVMHVRRHLHDARASTPRRSRSCPLTPRPRPSLSFREASCALRREAAPRPAPARSARDQPHA